MVSPNVVLNNIIANLIVIGETGMVLKMIIKYNKNSSLMIILINKFK